jgi:diguanylate cyclase (GGDEF)-like protein
VTTRSTTADTAAPDRPSSGLARGLSVWHYLVALTLLPALILPTLGIQLAHQHVVDAATAVRIEHDIAVIQDVDQLRNALEAEVTAGSLTMIANLANVTVTQISLGLGEPVQSLASSRAAVDRRLGKLMSLAHPSDGVPDVSSGLAAVRRRLNTAIATESVNTLGAVNLTYAALGDQLSTTERSMAHRLVSGGEGAISPSMVASARALEAIAAAVIVANQAEHDYLSLLYPTPSGGRTATLQRLQTEREEYLVRVGDLNVELPAPLRRSWQSLRLDAQFPEAISITTSSPRQDSITDAIGKIALVAPSARKVYGIITNLAVLLGDAVTQAVDQARADARVARHEVWVIVTVTVATLLITAVVLVLVGGLLRRRLGQLAAGAQRLSAGILDQVPVQGPRELALASRAINDAVASLRQVEAKAELLASGDLTSPDLERAAPGLLGAAVHQSVSRIVTAVREREVLQRQLAHQATHDDLTGLTNRAELERRLVAAIVTAQRTHTLLAVVFVDLDKFKACNDRLGHAAGDHVLRAVAERLRAVVGTDDIVARLGGDEFVVVIPAAGSEADVVAIGRRIVDAIGEPIWYQDNQIQIGASTGLSAVLGGSLSPDQMLFQADMAAYTAKSAGGGRLVVHNPDRFATPQ